MTESGDCILSIQIGHCAAEELVVEVARDRSAVRRWIRTCNWRLVAEKWRFMERSCSMQEASEGSGAGRDGMVGIDFMMTDGEVRRERWGRKEWDARSVSYAVQVVR